MLAEVVSRSNDLLARLQSAINRYTRYTVASGSLTDFEAAQTEQAECLVETSRLEIARRHEKRSVGEDRTVSYITDGSRSRDSKLCARSGSTKLLDRRR